ncbi:unnamed protein product [Nesidiocoris tenuis]|uniref:Uncharacterized protein n=1 Tax=Nesidiocoris tenuis TaxID=355587 RepID=A0A6H5GGM1_9HEMI|nr:unnamed protein product [Nesidiocoris tenuis]
MVRATRRCEERQGARLRCELPRHCEERQGGMVRATRRCEELQGGRLHDYWYLRATRVLNKINILQRDQRIMFQCSAANLLLHIRKQRQLIGIASSRLFVVRI